MAQQQIVTFDHELLKNIRLRKNELVIPLLTANLCQARDEYGTLLHYAVKGKNDWLAKALLVRGSRVDALDRRGQTALMVAIYVNDADCVRCLLSYGANIYMTATRGISTLRMLFYYENVSDDIVGQLVHKMKIDGCSMKMITVQLISAGCSAYQAVLFKDRQLLESLLNSGMRVNSTGYRRKTALMAAARLYDVELMDYLVRKGANVNALDADGKSALLHLQICAFSDSAYGSAEVILQFLLEHGADVNVRSRQAGFTPLYNVYAHIPEGTEGRRVAIQLDTWAELLLFRDALPQNTMNGKILKFANNSPESFRTQLLIAHIAMLELRGTPIILSLTGSSVEEYHTKYPEFGKYHDLCQQVLLMPIYEKLTLLDLLYESEKKMRMYVHDENFAGKLTKFYTENRLGIQCPLYYKKMEERVFQTNRMLELEDKTTFILSKIFNENCDVVAQIIISYLNKRDLENFCQIDH